MMRSLFEKVSFCSLTTPAIFGIPANTNLEPGLIKTICMKTMGLPNHRSFQIIIYRQSKPAILDK